MKREPKSEKFVRTILFWAKHNLRDFPWRRTNDPYRILVAEVMLQRTKVEKVVPVYKDFVNRYPDPQALARAPLEDIVTCIESLGLRKRAKALKLLAEQIVNDYASVIPKNRMELLALFGVGNYIADAVLCHAYGIQTITIDANLARVFKRVFSLKTKGIAQKDKTVRLLAARILKHANGHCRELNLAIIDLASSICTPKNPKCPECFLNALCDYAKQLRSLR